jgi:hypothetical protein
MVEQSHETLVNPLSAPATPIHRFRIVAMACCAFAFAFASSVAAQSARLNGQVVVAGSNQSIVGAIVELRVADTIRQTVTADLAGRFSILVPRDTSWSLAVRRLGFSPVELRSDSVRLGVELSVPMLPVATLDEMHITAASPAVRLLVRRGFFERQKAGFGSFLDSTTIARRASTSLLSLLRPYLKGCTMIFVDGIPGAMGGIDVSAVMAIEIYRSNLEAPQQFHNPLERGPVRCGSIVIWLMSDDHSVDSSVMNWSVHRGH